MRQSKHTISSTHTMTTPTPPADAPTPRTDAVNECAKRLILNRPFGSSTADLLQELADLYSKHAESLERFLGSALANNDPLREKVIEFQRELAAKDARIAALEKDVVYLLARQTNAGKCLFYGERDFGISSNSLVSIAYGESLENQKMPADASDLHACQLAFERLPEHRKTDTAKIALERATNAIEKRDAAREGQKS